MENRYVVFDWDGTLHDTKKLYAESVRRAYAFLADVSAGKGEASLSGASAGKGTDAVESSCKGFAAKSAEELSEDSLSKYLGMTAAAMWSDFMPGLEESIRAKAEKIVGDSMVELVYNKAAVLYDGVTEMLDTLKAAGFKLLILSNCKVAYLEAHKAVFDLEQWFTDYYPAQAYDFIPKEEILKLAMDKYPGEYVMIGDRYLDIKAGNECGVKTIGCSYGFGTAEELSEADYIADSPLDIVKIVMD